MSSGWWVDASHLAKVISWYAAEALTSNTFFRPWENTDGPPPMPSIIT
jgi:hypothetical protein